jgi:hypothetical protein
VKARIQAVAAGEWRPSSYRAGSEVVSFEWQPKTWDRERRFVVRRDPVAAGEQLTLDDGSYHYYVLVTNDSERSAASSPSPAPLATPAAASPCASPQATRSSLTSSERCSGSARWRERPPEPDAHPEIEPAQRPPAKPPRKTGFDPPHRPAAAPPTT